MKIHIFAAALSVAWSLGSLLVTPEDPSPKSLDIEFPTGPKIPTPMPPPAPSDGVINLKSDTQYVFDSNDPILVLTSPQGVLSVTEESGPVRIRGKFYGGSGGVESKTFKRKQVFVVEGLLEGKSAELLIVDKTSFKVIKKEFLTGGTVVPTPPPTPKPIDPPTPKPDPVKPPPIPADGLRVLIVYEAMKLSELPPSQLSLMTSKKFEDFLNANCVKGAGGKAEWRIWEQNVFGLENETKVWQDAMKLQRDSLPWIVVSNGVTGTCEPLPKTLDAALALIQKYTTK